MPPRNTENVATESEAKKTEPEANQTEANQTEANKETVSIQSVDTEPEVVEIESPEDLAGYVESLAQDGVSGTIARSYTAREGFRSLAPMVRMTPSVLATMSGCISYALAEQAGSGVEGAKEALEISIQYAQQATTLKANTVKLRSYCATALDFGYGSTIDNEEADIDDLSMPQMAQIVSAFLGAQKKAKVDTDFMAWTDALIAQTA